ncbi:MAG: class I SAM-dependent methyltransferase [Betaproteobacteria bacterium]|nr:MAG: class I SAM-dependent methyltransferase [Betaproteobacteria bacterium]
MTSPATSIVAEQLNYYRARAAEYDEWWLRQGRYDLGPKANAQWRTERALLDRVLDSFRPKGRILELAGGTGIWSEKLLSFASQLTIVDGSAEMLAINKARLKSDKVQYIEANIFDWRPAEPFDTVFFGFWLSHVPSESFDHFWGMVRSCLSPQGRVLFIDSFRESTSTATVRELRDRGSTMIRRLNDGREFKVCKIFYDPGKLANELQAIGWCIDVFQTKRYFIYGYGAPHDA